MTAKSVFLARLLGVWLSFVAVWMLVDRPGLNAMVKSMTDDRPLTVVVSMVTLAAGLALVLGHQIWSGGVAPVLITLFGWISVVKGALLLVLPNVLEPVGIIAAASGWMWISALLALVVGLILTAAGFRAPAPAAGI